jgi:ABC-2 type transport system ATP-binding protein
MRYGSVMALRNATFSVQRGEVVGLLGPNGAGKSTTMKILTTYLYPTSGSAVVGDKDVLATPLEVRQMIGYLPETLPLYPGSDVHTYLKFVGKARGLRGSLLRERTDWVVQRCGLAPMYRKLIRELSKGFRQRVGLAQALIHDPQVIMLDEPTSGLDPHQILETRHLIRRLARDKTVLLSTHILQEVEAVADRIVIINNGLIVGDGTPQELNQRAQQRQRLQLSVSAARAEVEAALNQLPDVGLVRYDEAADGFEYFTVDAAHGVQLWQQVSDLVRARGWQVGILAPQVGTLEETFLALTEPKNGVSGRQG